MCNHGSFYPPEEGSNCVCPIPMRTSELHAQFLGEAKTSSAPLALFAPAPSSLPNPTAPAGEGSAKGSPQGHAQPGLSVSPSALKAAQRAKRSQGESFESREVAYKRLLELAEDGDIDRLLNGFIEKEEKNFACFSYATELNNEMEKMQQRIKDLQVCSRLFMSPRSQLVLLGWGGFFLSHVSSITVHTRGRLTACHRGGIRGMQKYNSNRKTLRSQS